MFYGQFGEDYYLSHFFDETYKGICVDVGAYDGVSGSNTYYFEQKGWNVLCIEPIPESFNKCNSCRKNTVNCCASDYDKNDVEFNIIRLEDNNVSAISSLIVDERLMESHKHLIHNIETISVKVKSLNTIFQEENMPKKIDFISIDTENTELDVLKGLNFDIYNINFLIIENNFNENIIEEYLKTKNFKKFNRIVVNDFYVNNDYLNIEVHECFKIKHANYYITEHEEHGNVTEVVNILIKRYSIHNNCNIIVNNNLFNDTCINFAKKLFITFENKNTHETIKFIFDEGSKLDFEMMFNELNKHIVSIGKLIEVSIGEIIDKYSILELKKKYIKDPNKIIEIQKEMNVLKFNVSEITKSYFYKLLFHINEEIWLDTDKIKNIDLNLLENYKDLYINLSRQIFDNNQKRFRLKNYFNILQNSNIKECKSYSDNKCFITINEESIIYDKIAEINYLCISYDIIYFDKDFKDVIKKIFKNPNITFIDKTNNINMVVYDLSKYAIDSNIKSFFEFNAIKYRSSGKLGDFLNQLSVICEIFYDTGRKGELFITEDKYEYDNFTFGINYTYNDTYNIISSQKYIQNYKIYNNEAIDIDLSMWRNNISNHLSQKNNWYTIYNIEYDVSWGKHKWLQSKKDQKWSDKIIINITPYRFISYRVLDILKDKIKDKLQDCIFVSNEKEHYDYFINNTDIKIEYYKPKDFEETVTIINSCKLGFYGFSSISVIANALHKLNYIIGIDNIDFYLNNLNNKELFPFILDILV